MQCLAHKNIFIWEIVLIFKAHNMRPWINGTDFFWQYKIPMIILCYLAKITVG